MRKLILNGLIGLLCVYMSVGCASIIHGTSQDVQISSSPDDAEVWIDGARVGKTPTRLTLARKNDYLVRFVKEGYKEYTIKIEGKTSAWIIGNVIFGGIIGCGIDFISGGAYDLSPERLDVNLTKLAALEQNTISLPEYAFKEVDEIRLLGSDGTPELVISIK